MKKLTILCGTKINNWQFVAETDERRFNSVVGIWKCLLCNSEYHVVNASVTCGKSKRCIECGHKSRRKPKELLSVDRKRKLHLELTKEEKCAYSKYRKQEKRRSQHSIRGRAGMLFRQAKNRALQKGWEFDLSPEWVASKLEAGRCVVTKIPFDFGPPLNDEKYNWNAPSLDRIDPQIGYTRENTQVTIWRYNHTKGIMSSDEFENFCVLVARHGADLTDSKIVRL